jgi:hypothetical protein
MSIYSHRLCDDVMNPHVFVDESKARHYLLVAAVIQEAQVDRVRKAVGGLRLPGQARIQFTSESDPRRKAILSGMAAAGLSSAVAIYDVADVRNVKAARDAAMARLVDDVAKMGARKLVIEHDANVLASDTRIIRDRASQAGCLDLLIYEHRRAREECLLAIPDAVAWAWARGGEWRTRARPLVSGVVKL